MTLSASLARSALQHCHAAALHAVEPRRAILRALQERPRPERPVVLVSAGKAAAGMAQGLVEWLASHEMQPIDGIIVSPERVAPPVPSVKAVAGDHPVPGSASLGAATFLAEWLGQLPLDVDVHVALSGGATALLAGPLPGLSMTDVTRTFELLLSSGLDIAQANSIRKRVARWTAGRLALALHPRPISTWLLSDVPGDDPSVICSGPCHGDPRSARDVVALCRTHGLLDVLPSAVIAALEFETPKPSSPGATADRTEIVASNRVAMEAARSCAIALGYRASVVPKPLTGDAKRAGEQVARSLMHLPRSRFGVDDTLGEAARARVVIYGGETTVALPERHGMGGRNQELALAAARVLDGCETDVTLLAAGTDGRDGPTDAAGAIVDRFTWSTIRRHGVDPARALSEHDSYRALDAAGALLRTGMSGTNVMDLVLAIEQPPA